MVCRINQDFDLRVQLATGGVIHAALLRHVGPKTIYRQGRHPGKRIEAHDGVFTACRYYHEIKEPKNLMVKKTTAITCKSCQKSMGMIGIRASSKRYVVLDKDTGEFFKHGRYCNRWTPEIMDATLYKNKPAAVDRCRRTYFYDANGNELTYEEYLKRRKKGDSSLKREHKVSPKYEIKTLTLTLE